MITIVCVSANILFIALAYLLQSIGTSLVVVALASAAVLFVAAVYYSRPKLKPESIEAINGQKIIKSHKILTLATERVEQD